MSRRFGSPWCFPLGGWLHFWRVWFSSILQTCRIVNLVSKMQYSYQTAASAATPPSFSLTGWTISSLKLHCLAALLDVFVPCVQLLVCVQFGPQIFCNLSSPPRSTPLAPLVPVSHCPPFPIFSLLSSRLRFLPQRSVSFVFRVLRRIVRLELAASADG